MNTNNYTINNLHVYVLVKKNNQTLEYTVSGETSVYENKYVLVVVVTVVGEEDDEDNNLQNYDIVL